MDVKIQTSPNAAGDSVCSHRIYRPELCQCGFLFVEWANPCASPGSTPGYSGSVKGRIGWGREGGDRLVEIPSA